MSVLMDFEIIGAVTHAETFAVGSSIREIARLRKRFGPGRWRKRKGIARVRLSDGSIRLAEIHWYEAHGIGRIQFKIKQYID
jgi:hypothetical protein